MNSWQNLPKDLQLRDAQIASLTSKEAEQFFKLASQKCVLNTFTELFWEAMQRIRNNPNNASLQRCVDFLEERKRTLGRAYSYKNNSEIAKKLFAIHYNEVEYNIRWLLEQYNCTRKSKPYLLEV